MKLDEILTAWRQWEGRDCAPPTRRAVLNESTSTGENSGDTRLRMRSSDSSALPPTTLSSTCARHGQCT